MELIKELTRNYRGINQFYRDLFHESEVFDDAGLGVIAITLAFPIPYIIGTLEPLIETPIRKLSKIFY